MINQYDLRIILLVSTLVAACSTTPPLQKIVVFKPQSQRNVETAQGRSKISVLEEELKLLRKTVEEIQFETENTKLRQQDIFQDLDRRLILLEKNPQVLATTHNIEEEKTVHQPDVVIISDSKNLEVTPTPSSSSSSITTDASTVSMAEQEAYNEALELLKQSRYKDAINAFQYLVTHWPQSSLADDAHYWISEARYVNREFEAALNGFRTMVTHYSDSQRLPEALLKIGYIQYDIGAYTEAADTFRDILVRFPGHQVSVSAQTKLKRIEQTIQSVTN